MTAASARRSIETRSVRATVPLPTGGCMLGDPPCNAARERLEARSEAQEPEYLDLERRDVRRLLVIPAGARCGSLPGVGRRAAFGFERQPGALDVLARSPQPLRK